MLLTPDQLLWHFPGTDKVSLARYARWYWRKQIIWSLWQVADQLGLAVMTHRPLKADRGQVRAKVRLGRAWVYVVDRNTPGTLTREEANPDTGRRPARTEPGRSWSASDIRRGAFLEEPEPPRPRRRTPSSQAVVYDARAVQEAVRAAMHT